MRKRSTVICMGLNTPLTAGIFSITSMVLKMNVQRTIYTYPDADFFVISNPPNSKTWVL